MKKCINITGMGCPKCEAKVTKALTAIPGVTVEEVSHKKANAIVNVENVDDSALKNAVESVGFTVTEIK